ncbi:extracellular calcium-sensing receptor-like [Rhinatrema bivittatum]|uniref:extracellular calcium-sensing receptor-like n=1 Tax=Rhinatrema bivittatum TaxID=194408 RepID=UPI00112880AE|nr:extracellular calcium-sensing receptor-like [Rhinatrema bivittatum]XP_029437810.1 extracellular calcium-sensing receptor-like [Rhinatrema bivittatum]
MTSVIPVRNSPAMILARLAVLLMIPLPISPVDASGCTLRGLEEAGFRQDGDILIGGIFPVTADWKMPEWPSVEQPVFCQTFNVRTYGWVQAMVFAINEINQDQAILPNISLGFLIYDSCYSLRRALEGTSRIVNGQNKPILNYQCQRQALLSAVIGESRSTISISLARLLGLYRYPQVSFFSSSPLLNDKIQFPSFFRTIPSDDIQVHGLAQLVAHFGWTWVGLVSSEDDYGEYGSQLLKKELQAIGACVAFHETFPVVPVREKIYHITETVKRSSANVIFVFSSGHNMLPVMENFAKHHITGKVWIATEGWSTSPVISTKELSYTLSGTIGLTVHEGDIHGFRDFLRNLRPFSSPSDIFIKSFWEETFRCQLQNYENPPTQATSKFNTTRDLCTGSEKLEEFKSQTSIEDDNRISYNVYNAIYSVAHALQSMKSCVPGEGPFTNKRCADIQDFKPWQLLHYMKKVHFWNKLGEEMYYDSAGNPPAVYDIINWNLKPDGAIRYVKVGSFDSRASRGQELSINISAIWWNTQHAEIPRSVCSESCPSGYWKAVQKGQPLCCFDCLLCAEGEISNMTDSTVCWPCPVDHWPNWQRCECEPKRIEFLTYRELLGGTLTAVACFFSITTTAVFHIFIKYHDTPIVKANNRELSFLLLGALFMSFLCSFLFIGEPWPTTCLIRQSAFGIIFALCVSCVLAKTIMVVIAFNATKPNSNLRGWLGPQVPIVIVSASTLVQILICATWLLLCPPFPEKNMKLITDTIIWQCNECSDVAFWCMLGYMGCLACVSFVVAFLARKLPDSFNEAKWITFSMLVFLSIWLSFIPSYLSTQGKYTVAVEVFGIISSSAGILICIFFPKCYIMVLRPEMNTREQLLGKGTKNKKVKSI